MKVHLKIAVACALVGYAVALAIGFLSAKDAPRISFTFIACICPPALLSNLSMTDPNASAVLLVLAPMNALIYAGIATGLYAITREAKREFFEFRRRG